MLQLLDELGVDISAASNLKAKERKGSAKPPRRCELLGKMSHRLEN